MARDVLPGPPVRRPNSLPAPPISVWELVIVLGLFVVLTLAWVWPWPRHLDTHLVAAPYWWDGQLNTYILAQSTENLWTRPGDLFQSRVLHPTPDVVAYSENLLAFAVPAGLLRLLGSSPLAVHGGLLVAGVALTGLTSYAWLRRRVSPAAALVAAALLTFAPFRLGWLSRIQLAVGFVAPLLLIAVERLLEAPSGRRAALVGALVTVQCGVSLYGAVHLAVFLVPTALVWGAVRLWSDRTLRSWRLGAAVALGLAVSLAGAASIALVYRGVSEAQGLQRAPKMLAGTSGRYADLRTTSDMQVAGQERAWKVDEASAREPIAAPGTTLLVLAALGLLPALGMVRAKPPPLLGPLTYAAWLPVALLFFLGTGPDAPGGDHGLYAWLRGHVPGLAGFRYPSRVVAVAALPLGLLAASGLHALSGLLTRRAAALPAAIAAAFGFVELRTKPLELRAMEPTDAAYRWCADRPGGEALVELPLKTSPHEPRVLQNLGTLVHGLPTVNGYTGYDPPWLRYAKERFDGFPDAESEELLRSLGIDRVIVHLHELRPSVARSLRVKIGGTPWLHVLEEDEDDLLLEVRGVPDGFAQAVRDQVRAYAAAIPAPPTTPRGDWTLAAPAPAIAPERLRDGESATRFTTGQVQKAGVPWLTIRFPRPRAVSEVWFDLRQGAHDAPLGLRITGLVRGADGVETDRPLYEAPFHAPVVPLAAASSAATDRVVFPAAVVDGITISSMRDSTDRWGSIHELWVGP